MLLPELKQNNQTLGDLIATLKQPAETNEFRFKITAEDVTCYGQQVLRDFELFVESQADFAVDRETKKVFGETCLVNMAVGGFATLKSA